ncbi:MAG: elongation factor 4 [Candidatus Liptonbacteria bacterium]|nr:elongation factor 4 [Candidatus Liptonbacteria bacterium]
MKSIRNFVIIAHVDAGKSTLADRFLEVTGTVPARQMRPQYLDQLELERERGITIKMAPVTMRYRSRGAEYTMNLIDTPGHSDFSYEVSRALAAVEGAILLVDATKGIQAQTLSNFRAAKNSGLTIVGAINKIDLGTPEKEKLVSSVAELLGVPERDVLQVSAKTGEGVEALLDAVLDRVPPPQGGGAEFRALVFDSLYDEHKGILAYIRAHGGTLAGGGRAALIATGTQFRVKEVGKFFPELRGTGEISFGEIGYVATGLKEADLVKIGDTLSDNPKGNPLPGYREPAAAVFISMYPSGGSEFEELQLALSKLRLSDPALLIEPEANEALGRGYKVGFLGQLHLDITASRLRDEFGVEFLTSFPSVAYRVRASNAEYVVTQASDFPEKYDSVREPMIRLEILTPPAHMPAVLGVATAFGLSLLDTRNIGPQLLLTARMPLAELLRDFDDQLKSATAGFASFSYELDGYDEAHVEKLEILIAGDVVPALTRVVASDDLDREARASVEKLKQLLPAQQFAQAIQAQAKGRIIARETIAALKKDVTGYLYGGDRSRKMKLWKKQKRGKERLKESGKVRIPTEVFREILKK